MLDMKCMKVIMFFNYYFTENVFTVGTLPSVEFCLCCLGSL
jgi:hypothetical protein